MQLYSTKLLQNNLPFVTVSFKLMDQRICGQKDMLHEEYNWTTGFYIVAGSHELGDVLFESLFDVLQCNFQGAFTGTELIKGSKISVSVNI